jgi:YrbI family 3-deoxy-D-manno-octulosonate 8-phosphate phosphatase
MAHSRSCVAIIPARGGSERVPRKNLLRLAGLPLVAHSIRHARSARLVTEVYVSTDDAEIADVARNHGARVVDRPPHLATSTATSESALIHTLDCRLAEGHADPDFIVFLQCTSPVRKSSDIDAAIETLWESSCDSLLSVTENTRYVWTTRNGEAVSINYDYQARQREQDLHKQYEENGSIYVCRSERLRASKNRLSGRIGFYQMDYWSSFQIDTPEDVRLCEWILAQPEYRITGEWPAGLQLIVFDFDGVMTDNRVLVDQHGGESVSCSRADGLGIERLQAAGFRTCVISKEQNPVVGARCAKLNVPCFQGVENKLGFLRQHLAHLDVPAADVAYVGNDVNDLECMGMVGFPVAVSDAEPRVLSAARLVLSRPGGNGAVREFCDLVLEHSQAKER